MKNYFFKFLTITAAISVSIILFFQVADWWLERNNRQKTIKALKLIQNDMERDTSLYHLRIEKILEPKEKYLQLGFQESLTVKEFKKLHKALRSGAEHKVFNFGYEYFQNHVSNPIVKNDSMLMWIGYYYELSGPEGNYGRWNASYSQITDENYRRLFDQFPNFFHSDTSIANQEIRRNLPSFKNSKYWQGRLRLTHREMTGIMLPIFRKNLSFAEDLLEQIKEELK